MSSELKVMHLISRFNSGGTANWIYTLNKALIESGIESLVVTGSIESNELEDARYKEFEYIKLHNLRRKIQLIKDFRLVFILRRILKDNQPNILNTHAAKAGLIGRLASIGLPVKVIHTYHGHLLYGYFNKPISLIFTLVEIGLKKLTDGYVFVGNSVKKDLEKYKIPRNKLNEVIFPTLAKVPKTRLSRVNNSIGWLGRLTKIKNPELLVDIAKLLPDLKFLMAGDGELTEKIRLLKPENLELLGWVESEDFWSKCSMALLTSNNEGIPTSLIEAAAAGLPLISTDVGSVSDILHKNRGGYFFNSAIEAATKIKELEVNPKTQKEFGEYNKKLFDSEFSIDNFIEKHLDLYNQVLQAH